MSVPERPEPPLELAADLLARSGREGTVRVRGDSMRPTLLPDRSVRVRFSAERPRLGDLVIFRQADYLVVHRFLGRARRGDGGRCLRTRGDGVPRLDPVFDPGRGLVGRVIAIERPEGWRSVVGAGARCYAVAVALHDLFWAALGVLAGRTDARLGTSLAGWVARLDHGILRGADALFFPGLHARTEAPAEIPERREVDP